MADPTIYAYDTRHLVLLCAKSLHMWCMNLTETHVSQTLLVVSESHDRQSQSKLSVPASWASGASTEAGGTACLSAPVGPTS